MRRHVVLGCCIVVMCTVGACFVMWRSEVVSRHGLSAASMPLWDTVLAG